MLEFLAEYIAAMVEEKCDLNSKFEIKDIVDPEDLNYLTQEGREKLEEVFESRIDRSIDGIVKLHDNTVERGIVYKKVAKRVKNVNYFANKHY